MRQIFYTIFVLVLTSCTSLKKGAKPISCVENEVIPYDLQIENNNVKFYLKSLDENGNSYPIDTNFIAKISYWENNSWIETNHYKVETKNNDCPKKMCVVFDQSSSMNDKIMQTKKAIEIMIMGMHAQDKIALLVFANQNAGIKSFYSSKRVEIIKSMTDSSLNKAYTRLKGPFPEYPLKVFLDSIKDKESNEPEHVIFISDFSGILSPELAELSCSVRKKNIIVHRIIYSTMLNTLLSKKNSRKKQYVRESNFGPLYEVKWISDFPKVFKQIRAINCTETLVIIERREFLNSKFKVSFSNGKEIIVKEINQNEQVPQQKN